MQDAAKAQTERIQRALGPVSDAGRSGLARESSVLAPFVPGARGLDLLFTLRTRDLPSHPGQLSFPGGRLEAGDRDPLAAALRETEEEIRVPRTRVQVWGHLCDYTTFNDVLVHCFVGQVARDDIPRLRPGHPEVERILLVPLERLLDPLRPAGGPLAEGLHDVAGYELRELLEAGTPRQIHYWRLSDGTTLWGVTADLVAILLERCFAWSPPSPPRRVEGRSGVLP